MTNTTAAERSFNVSDALKLTGRVCVVTGAASGMGYEIVRGFAQSDARGIAMIDINDDLGEKVRGELSAEFPRITFKYYHLNISEYEDVQKVYGQVVEDFGEINVQVSCAGIAGYTAAVDHTPETWHKVLNVNLHGTFWTAQAAGRQMIAQNKGGSIIIIGSISAHVVNRPDFQPGLSNYCISKGACVQMAKVLGVEWAQHNIRVNSLSPGNMKTPLAPTDEKSVNFFNHYTPLGRMGAAWEVAGAAVYLASDASSFQTSTDILVDGGLVHW
ncbi:hypothetical protein BC943DRAFT_320476 [Umbelopsis sp. AD052]|nr:hypothetical protein BC943DRAFT_320476 [Umbelopsis sp. AD052]